MWKVKQTSVQFPWFTEVRFHLYNTETNEYYLDGEHVRLWNNHIDACDKANSLNGVQFGTLNIGDMFYRNFNKYIKVPQYTHMGNKECNVFWRNAEQWWPHNCAFSDDIYVLPCERE